MEKEVATPKLNDTERREVNPEKNKSQINPSTETHNETVKAEWFETPIGESTRESIITNTNNKGRSTKIPAHKLVTKQKRDSLVATSEKSKGEGEEFPNKSTASEKILHVQGCIYGNCAEKKKSVG